MNWFKTNWKRFALVAAGAVGALTAEHTIAHKVADWVSAIFNSM